MTRSSVVAAVIAGCGAIACSATMGDLSDGEDSRPGETATKGGESANPDLVAVDLQADPPPVDKKLDPAPAGAPLQTGCNLVTFTATSMQSTGAGVAWRDPQNGADDDGANAEATLSTDARESAQLVFGGFTGPAMPANATIKGLLVDVDRSSGGTCIVATNVSATLAGTVRSRPDANDPWQGIRIYGGIDDTWGAGPVPASSVNVAAFSVSLSTRMVGSKEDCKPRDARIDALRIRVHYCVP